MQDEPVIERLTPCCYKGISESVEVINPGSGNGAEYGIIAQGKITNKHCGMAECLVEGIRVVNSAVERLELHSAGGTFCQCPCVLKQTVQEA
jgi:hypothetical protein